MRKITAHFTLPSGAAAKVTAEFTTLPGEGRAQWEGSTDELRRHLPPEIRARPVPTHAYAETFEAAMRGLAAGAGPAIEIESSGEWLVCEQ